MHCMNFETSSLKKALDNIFDDKLKEKVKKLKEVWLLDPLSYLIFTRVAELSAIKYDLVMPTRLDIEDMFKYRDRISCAVLKTLKDIIFNQYISEIRQGGGPLIEYIEDMIYVLNRIEGVQFKIDEIILSQWDEILWEKEEIVRLYTLLIDMLIDFVWGKVKINLY